MIDLTGWAAIGGWRGASRAVQPIGAFAAKRLDRLWGTVEPTGRSLARMDEESRHQLRIQVKKMRYAVEFFDRLFPASKAKKRFGVAVEAVQEALGKLNDMATARTIKIGDESGWWQEQSEELSSLRDAELAMKQLGKAGPFWRRPA
jgi:CHAD domain-containing protein